MTIEKYPKIIRGNLPTKFFLADLTTCNLKQEPKTLIAQKIPELILNISFKFNNGKNIAWPTREGTMSCGGDPVIVTVIENGIENSYPITKEEYDNTYEKVGDVYRFKPKFILALQVDKPFSVHLPWKSFKTYGNTEDYLVVEFTNLENKLVFSKSEFEKNYKIIGSYQKLFEKYANYLRTKD